MTAMAPVEVYGLRVPAGSVAVEADGGVRYPATFRITMAAIDPTAEVDPEHPRVATLKLIKVPSPDMDEEDDDEDDDDEDDDEEFDEDDIRAIEKRLGLGQGDDEDDSDSEEEAGPSDPSKGAKARAAAALAKMLDGDDEDMADALTNGVNGVKKNKGKGKVLDALEALDDEEDDDELDDEDLEDEIKEYIICTLDPTKNCQQTLDITLNNENELCYFQVSGGYDIYLTGNFVIPPLPADDEDDEDEEDYDDEDMLLGDGLDEDLSDMEDDEEDELDDLDDPRVMEVDTDEEEAPALVKATAKGKNKRGAEDADLDASLDILEKIVANEAPAADAKLSKKDKKKLKNNAGEAVPTAAASEKGKKEEAKAKATPPKDAVALAKETPTSNGKKVQFAKNLEQGPTPSKTDSKGPALGVKVVDGVTIDDKKLGTGKQAKKGSRVELRYIGKLKDGKVFDSNKKGKPFSFNLGAGEVVKGMDIGLQGMSVGGERRITIPSKLGYGSKAMGKDIPANSDLIFDIKLISIN